MRKLHSYAAPEYTVCSRTASLDCSIRLTPRVIKPQAMSGSLIPIVPTILNTSQKYTDGKDRLPYRDQPLRCATPRIHLRLLRTETRSLQINKSTETGLMRRTRRRCNFGASPAIDKTRMRRPSHFRIPCLKPTSSI